MNGTLFNLKSSLLLVCVDFEVAPSPWGSENEGEWEEEAVALCRRGRRNRSHDLWSTSGLVRYKVP